MQIKKIKLYLLLLAITINVLGLNINAQTQPLPCHLAKNISLDNNQTCCDVLMLDCHYCSGFTLLPTIPINIEFPKPDLISYIPVYFYQYRDSPPLRPPV